jgi:hypothetical protein
MFNSMPCRRRAIFAERNKQSQAANEQKVTFVIVEAKSEEELENLTVKDVLRETSVPCEKCGKFFKPKGLGKHMSTCKKGRGK